MKKSKKVLKSLMNHYPGPFVTIQNSGSSRSCSPHQSLTYVSPSAHDEAIGF